MATSSSIYCLIVSGNITVAELWSSFRVVIFSASEHQCADHAAKVEAAL